LVNIAAEVAPIFGQFSGLIKVESCG